jgi:CheY-like chemotaxis protein
MKETGNRLVVARNAADAYEQLRKAAPDAVILDLMMPDIDGFEVLKNIRETQPSSIPVLVLTAKHITQEELKFLSRNNIHQLIKKGSVNREELLIAINRMLIPEVTELKKPIERPVKKIEGKAKVLVVEDNPDNMLSVNAILSEDFNLIGVSDGLMAVEAAKDEMPDLILMDISLPGMDGIEAFKRIRNYPLTEHIPIVALTASAMASERETILSNGFDAFVSKPAAYEDLLKIIRGLSMDNKR